MQQQRIAFPERVNQMLRALQCEANQIDDDVRTQLRDAVAETAGSLLPGSIDRHPLDFRPLLMRLIRFPLSATYSDDVVSGDDETRNEKGADVAGGANDDDAPGRQRGHPVCGKRGVIFSAFL